MADSHSTPTQARWPSRSASVQLVKQRPPAFDAIAADRELAGRDFKMHGPFALKILQRVGAILLLIAATFGVYWPALKNGFVWDDTALVLRDPLIRSWRLIPESFHHFLFLDATASNFYRPLQRLSFMGDYALWEFFPRGYHLTSILTHLVAAVMLFLLAEIWLGQRRRWFAFAVALVWAVHPIHTSAVTYVSGRADSLAAIFGFLGLALGLTSLAGGKRAKWAAVGAGICFFAALLSKESGLAALLIWFLVLIWRRVPWKFIGKWALAAVAILAVYGTLRSTADRTLPPSGASPRPIERPVLVARAVAEYAGLLVAPTNLRMERDVRPTTSGDPAANARSETLRGYQTFAGVLLIVLIAAWFWWARRRVPEAALALLAAVVAYIPISNVFALNATAAEHWLYVPSAFLFVAIAASLSEFGWFQRPLVGRFGAVVLAAWTVWLGIRTWNRHADWLDQPTFLLETIKAGGDTARMHVNLGRHKASKGQNEEALEEFQEALRIDPGQPHALFGLASISSRLGRYQEARDALDRVKDDSSIAADLLQLRAAIDYAETKTDPTLGMKAAADAAPKNWFYRERYFTALVHAGKLSQAARELGAFLREQPFRADSWKMLGDILARQRQRDAAMAAYEEAVRLDVHHEEARRLARILAQSASAKDSQPEPPADK